MSFSDAHALYRSLPAGVQQRLRPLSTHPPRAAGAFVLYWMRMAVRGHENPALDAAIAAANALALPVLVYHGVSERYRYASDRHHTFILEGARDVAAELASRGIAYALHVERQGVRGPYLAQLGEAAALVVTEDVPVPPLDAWTQRLEQRLAAHAVPLWAVDASCVVPMPMVKVRYERAYAFRAATKRIAEESLAQVWEDIPPSQPPYRGPLPFSPIDVRALAGPFLAHLVASCQIDHGVGPSAQIRGGSRAGYARWEEFCANRLGRYARDRNDPVKQATSRLSPYLHYGHVSVLRIARSAMQGGGEGREKFLDELLVWRELAWHFAAHLSRGELETVGALPDWARRAFESHANDPRHVLPMETLERGQTGDALWDAAQRALLATGELHNNLRMTWGKAVPGWTRDLEHARSVLVELNNRYALDGRDPSSYGGLYWCLGLFDRPFSEDCPVHGRVRARATAQHARRIDLDAYAKQTRAARPRVSVGIVGAGLAGLACGRTLADHGLEVTVFDKGRAPGGRLSARRTDGHLLDLGAQYFTVRDERFGRWVRSWQDVGVCAPWRGRVVVFDAAAGDPRDTTPAERLVGKPSMDAIAHHMAAGLALRSEVRVTGIARGPTGLCVRGVRAAEATPREEELGEFDAVLVCLPPEQAAPLVEPLSGSLGPSIRAVRTTPCFAVGIAAEEGSALARLGWDGAFVRGEAARSSGLSWAARDSSKPGRSAGERWVLHATPRASEASAAQDEREAAMLLVAAFARLVGLTSFEPIVLCTKRWRYADVPRPMDDGALFDEGAGVGVAGDWVAGGRVEGAFLSGVALAGRVLGTELARGREPSHA